MRLIRTTPAFKIREPETHSNRECKTDKRPCSVNPHQQTDTQVLREVNF